MSIRDHAEDLGYIHNCRGCGQKSDTPWCGCLEGAPEDFPQRIAERETIESLNEQIDELAGTAAECETLPSAVKTLLDLAWWFTEDRLREGLGSCGHNPRAREGDKRRGIEVPYCACCAHYDELRAKAENIRGRL